MLMPVSIPQLNKHRHFDVFRIASASDGESAEAVSFCLSKIEAGYDCMEVLAIGSERLSDQRWY